MKIFIVLLILSITYAFKSYCQTVTETYPNMTDNRDGKVYKTVKIGIQIWLAENVVYNVKDGAWPLDMNKENEKKYGLLYTWNAAQKACPTGWHLPTMEEWKELFEQVGLKDIYKGAFIDDSGWDNSISTTNSSGLSVLPGGCIDSENVCLEQFAQFWTSTKLKKEIYYILIDANVSSIHKKEFKDNVCLSIRCVKNN
ncbi:MAG: FISUMP domain-containing protein [Bacteroidales bacterium]